MKSQCRDSHAILFFWPHTAAHSHTPLVVPFSHKEQCWWGPVIQLSNQCTHCWAYHPLCTSSPLPLTFTVNLPHMPFISYHLSTNLPSITLHFSHSSRKYQVQNRDCTIPDFPFHLLTCPTSSSLSDRHRVLVLFLVNWNGTRILIPLSTQYTNCLKEHLQVQV